MPKRPELRKVLVIGSGPITIGQAAEFDYAGTQACRSLREEGVQVVVMNSNPATIQTDIDIADRVYVEPLELDFVLKVLEKERPQGILSGMGGQTALNLCSELAEAGVLERMGIELLGTPIEAIKAGEDRDAFRETMQRIGEPVPASTACTDLETARKAAEKLRYPVIVRSAYTLGGMGSGIVRNEEELKELVPKSLAYSRIHQILVEESVKGWKEFEYEVVRDGADNCITICNMENLDPMGIHTGESIVIAPAQTLTEREHQTLRSAAIKIVRALGVRGGCNIQFAVDPHSTAYRIIEVNPRLSRSSALASKATGYPIARVAAKIAIGMTLDEIPNAITGRTMASFEPTLDYVVLKIPKWPFDKFPKADRRIGTQMKSTGEVMAIGRTVEEALMKAVRSLDLKRIGLEEELDKDTDVLRELAEPTDRRLFAIADALRKGYRPSTISDITKWDEFFLRKIANLIDMEKTLSTKPLTKELVYQAKRMGFPVAVMARLAKRPESEIWPLVPPTTFKMVDTCGAEFEASTPYFYSTIEDECDATKVMARRPPTAGGRPRRVLVVGSGPIRIGQGIEFDACAVHGIMALREMGVEASVLNNNPETVSTDFDISDRLYFDPITLEDVLHVIDREQPDGIILQFGGQTALNIAVPLQEAIRERGLPTRIFGTSAQGIDLAEDRKLFGRLITQLGIRQPDAGTGFSFEEVREVAAKIGYPVVVRPSYVLGGLRMEIVYNEQDLQRYMGSAIEVTPAKPVLVDRYLTHATEIDVDAVCDGRDVFIGGVLEHIEEAGVHSGDATMVLPAQHVPQRILEEVTRIVREVSIALGIVGLVNFQLAVKDGDVYVLEANPRASRTVPFVSKATGIPLAKVATRVMLGASLRELGLTGMPQLRHVAVKASVFPFLKLPGVDAVLGPEMKSTGEVMGIDSTFERAFYKAMLAAGNRLPTDGKVYLSVRDEDKPGIVPVARSFVGSGLEILATKGTAGFLREHGIPVTTVYRIAEHKFPDALDLMRKGEIQLVINTPTASSGAQRDGAMMRRLAVDLQLPFLTRIEAAAAAAQAIERIKGESLDVQSLNEYVAPLLAARTRS